MANPLQQALVHHRYKAGDQPVTPGLSPPQVQGRWPTRYNRPESTPGTRQVANPLQQALVHHGKEEWRKEAADIPPSKVKNDPCSTRQIVARFRGRLLRDGAERVWVFLSATMPTRAETEAETTMGRRWALLFHQPQVHHGQLPHKVSFASRQKPQPRPYRFSCSLHTLPPPPPSTRN